jgi:hypothetical protein
MKTIEREHFEAWLFSQPKDREFDYQNTTGGCAICSFVIANMRRRYLELFPETETEVKDQAKASASPAANQAMR